MAQPRQWRGRAGVRHPVPVQLRLLHRRQLVLRLAPASTQSTAPRHQRACKETHATAGRVLAQCAARAEQVRSVCLYWCLYWFLF